MASPRYSTSCWIVRENDNDVFGEVYEKIQKYVYQTSDDQFYFH